MATHEIDSAYWQEWKLFHLPGGIQFFLVLNLVLLLVVLYGFDRVIRLERGTKMYSYILAGAGIFAFIVHIGFIAVGRPEFRLPVSVSLLVVIFVVSIAQIVIVHRTDLPYRDDTPKT